MSTEQVVAVMVAFAGVLSALGIVLGQVVALRRQVDGHLTELLDVTQHAILAQGRLEARPGDQGYPSSSPTSSSSS